DTEGGRPHRILFATATDFNFTTDTIREYADRPDVEVRKVDVRRLQKGPWRPDPAELTRNRLRHSAGIPMEVPIQVREPFDWADTIFVEWGHRAMAWISMLPDVRARVVVRLHSYEALTQFPLITDWSGIDDLIFVSGHIRALVEHAIPEVLSGPRIHTIGNRNVMDSYNLPKRLAASRTLGLIGWGQVVKDAQWALDVLEELRRDDPTWRLRMIGNGFADDSKLTKAAAQYKARLEERIEGLGDAVIRPGFTRDVPHALRRVGVILSTSQREGTHESLIQGAASGALPVVRNWPVVARWGGAHTMFPESWIVETPQEAADRIREAVATGDLLAEGAKAREWVLAHYDWSVIGPRLESLLMDKKEGSTP
ncbi:MAG TPA: glycosyltransferase, partial [Intrasporangium sp.]|nr:glycosyltransferase [Intrasporangium sp.]